MDTALLIAAIVALVVVAILVFIALNRSRSRAGRMTPTSVAPQSAVEWQLGDGPDGSQVVVNTGQRVAHQVMLTGTGGVIVHPDNPVGPLASGEYLRFSVPPGGGAGRLRTVTIHWRDDADGAVRVLVAEVDGAPDGGSQPQE